MSLRLSSEELQQLARSIQVLVSPMDHQSLDRWRSAVNCTLGRLLRADSAGFLLPIGEGLALFSDEHDPAELARFPDYPPPPTIDGTPLFEGMVREKVMTNATWYGKHYHLYTGSPYYNEYAAANGAHDTLAASLSLGPAFDARSSASLMFWHSRPTGRLFGGRELSLLRVLYPAFCSGVGAAMLWRAQAKNLNATFEWLEQPAVVASSVGTVLYRSASLAALLSEESESDALETALHRAVTAVARARSYCISGHRPGPMTGEITTSSARYRLCAFRLGQQSMGGAEYIVAGLQRLTARVPTVEELHARFGLTPAEGRVAQLIARGRTSSEIAAQLGVSVHTARRHAEKIFQKLNVESRTAATARMFG